ncbi:MinD-like ATPase involved in chromosome partitioning or flagellar assembly [Microbacterium sp. SLBN-154]|uniref:AAA family ATPase n=1 Tax=Microbacterium sp. SLBN-154 TaxID=2768458 RepID=UPI00114E9651|nr:P-loop NTPase [Microbacterium sp. SLBN-154]TQK19046.1 MinD-like ATPase involved in chromosome partitioning or flagellar assembly [Microbacterium sp. SLBN-154]
MKVLVAVDEPRGADLADQLAAEGLDVVAVVAADALALAGEDAAYGSDARITAVALREVEAVILQADRRTMTAAAVALCDRQGVRIVALCAQDADRPLVDAYGVSSILTLTDPGWRIAEAITMAGLARGSASASAAVDEPGAEPGRPAPRVIAVWGPAGSPGRSTVAVELALELARGGRRVALVDADAHAPALALALGLADEGPGFAAACRHAGRGELTTAELERISTPLSQTGVRVLTGINRPSRWPELSHARVAAALEACRSWVEFTVVDVSSSLERDEEIVSDLDGPRRNAATLAALDVADHVVAVAAADPVGIARFLRGYTELRATVGPTPVAVLANRLRPGPLGIDARGQVRRTLDRFAGIRDVWFVPHDARSADAALLTARPIAEVAPRSPFAAAIRRFVGEALAPPAPGVSRRAQRERRVRPARAKRERTGRGDERASERWPDHRAQRRGTVVVSKAR